MPDKRAGVYSISIVSRLTGMHEQTIRQYERLGLVSPQRTPGGTRTFSEDDLERLLAIASLTREMGVNLAGVEIILKMRERQEAMLALMREIVSQLDESARARLEAIMRGDTPGLIPVRPAGLARTEPPAAERGARKIEIKGK